LAVCWSGAFRCVNTTKRRKEVNNDRREAIVAAHQFGKGYKILSKLFGVHRSAEKKIIHKWKILKTVVQLSSKFNPMSDCAMLR